MFRRRPKERQFRRRPQRAPSGCGIILLIAVATCVLLVLNGYLVSGLLAQLGDSLPEMLRSPKVLQTILFIGPVLLLVLEWKLTLALLRRLDELWRGRSGA